ncbi:hypothetical protein BDZ89DRAFT_822514 [Hymenopellis radicata]|nr:hypothetical protein BDZ89DRAFT_822514 [Hymenopellis radicata]
MRESALGIGICCGDWVEPFGYTRASGVLSRSCGRCAAVGGTSVCGSQCCTCCRHAGSSLTSFYVTERSKCRSYCVLWVERMRNIAGGYTRSLAKLDSDYSRSTDQSIFALSYFLREAFERQARYSVSLADFAYCTHRGLWNIFEDSINCLL